MSRARRKNLAVRRQIRRNSVHRRGGRLTGEYTGSAMCPSATEPGVHLLVDGRPVAPLEVAKGRRARTRGLLGCDGIDGALLLPSTGSVHTFAMRFPLDIALCTADLRVVAIRTLRPGRLLLPRWRVQAVVEAEAGAFAVWGLAVGSRLALDGCGARPRGHVSSGRTPPGPT